MRVLHVYKTFYPDSYGGIEQAICHLVHGGAAHGIVSEVFTLSHNPQPERFETNNVFVTQARTNVEFSSTPFSAQALAKFKALAPSFDLIHYHYPYPFGDVIKLFSGIKKPSIVTYHSDIIRQRLLKYLYAPVQSIFLNSVDRIVCTSDIYLKTSRTLQKYRDKTTSVPLGLDEKSFPNAGPEVIQKWKKELEQSFFLFLGVLRNYKGVGTLLKAARGLNSKLVIAGDGPEFASLKSNAQELGLENVYFTGRITEDDKAALLELCQGLVLPSHLRSEAFGLVQLEAAMRSKPLICTELGTGTSYVNEHENTGLVVPPKNVDALRNAMNFMVYHPKIAARMGEEAHGRFIELFSAERMCNEYARIYREVIAEYYAKRA